MADWKDQITELIDGWGVDVAVEAFGMPVSREDRRVVAKVGTDGLELGDSVTERNEIDDVTLEGDHRAEGLLMHGPDGPQSEAGGQYAVVRGRRSASLDVTQHGHARVVARALFECVGDELADTTELSVTEGVDLAAGNRSVPSLATAPSATTTIDA